MTDLFSLVSPHRRRPALPVLRRPRVGLALGGGGARGYAHIGVLRVLEREGIPIDYLAGTSMGGLIAAGYAAGLTPEQMETEALRLQMRRLLDISLRRMGLLEGKRVREHLVRLLGKKEFSDTRIPLRLVAVDLETGEEVALDQGPLVDAVRATISVPGVFCPTEWRGHHLVDGGLINNVPADVVRTMGAEVVIAVDVGTPPANGPEWGAQQWRFRLPGLTLVGPMLDTLLRSAQIMQAEIVRHRLELAHPDVLIRPDIGPVRTEEFERAADVIPAGERAAAEALPRIRALLRRRLFWS